MLLLPTLPLLFLTNSLLPCLPPPSISQISFFPSPLLTLPLWYDRWPRPSAHYDYFFLNSHLLKFPSLVRHRHWTTFELFVFLCSIHLGKQAVAETRNRDNFGRPVLWYNAKSSSSIKISRETTTTAGKTWIRNHHSPSNKSALIINFPK